MKYEPIPNYGTKITLKEFIEACKKGDVIDFDGFGHYMLNNIISEKIVKPSDITGRRNEFNKKTGKCKLKKVPISIDKSFTHVVWFNR